ncbi:hypothetical protein IJD44_11260 [bacterium]|nr:hypothetical protein [bacterium]
MKKTLLTLLLTGIITVSYCATAQAADITFTKPTIKFNTTKEEAQIQKAKSDIEKAKADAKAQQEKREKEIKAKQEQNKKAAEAKKAEKEKAYNNVKQNAKDTADSFKNLFK